MAINSPCIIIIRQMPKILWARNGHLRRHPALYKYKVIRWKSSATAKLDNVEGRAPNSSERNLQAITNQKVVRVKKGQERRGDVEDPRNSRS
jgi:hypothetical protein